MTRKQFVSIKHLMPTARKKPTISNYVRALYKDLPVFIIDEGTAGLNGITERSIRENLSEIVNDKIVIIVTHSNNFIMDNHRIKQGELKCLK